MPKLLFLLPILFLSCAAPSPTSSLDPARVWHPSAETLYRSYQDESERYTGTTVEIELRSRTYLVSGRAVHWHKFESIGNPDIVFTCLRVPADNSQTITLVGQCRGRKDRPDGSWFVSVMDCVDQSR